MKTLIPRNLLFSCKTYLIGNVNKSRNNFWEGVTPRDPIFTKMSPRKSFFPCFDVSHKNGYFDHIFSMKATRYGAKSISWKIGWEGGTPQDPTCTKMSPKTSFFLVCLYYIINFFFFTETVISGKICLLRLLLSFQDFLGNRGHTSRH